jgi:hypothetical protein
MIVTMIGPALQKMESTMGDFAGEALAEEYDAQPAIQKRVPKIGGVVSSIMYSMDMYGYVWIVA